MTQAIPEGFSTITPNLMIKDAAKAIEQYKKAFGAQEIGCATTTPDGKIMHACLRIGSSMLFIADQFPGMSTSEGAGFYLYVPDADSSMEQAKKAGLVETMATENMFWGDRLGAVKDQFGIQWSIATHVKDVSEDDVKKGAEEMMSKMKEQGCGTPTKAA